MSSRWIRFFIVIGIGIVAGLFYGWVINPVKYVDTSPDTLKIDYKTDYVLMVAEAYHVDGDLALAVQRLAFLGDTPPSEMAQQAVQFAETMYSQDRYYKPDLDLLRALSRALQTANPGAETIGP